MKIFLGLENFCVSSEKKVEKMCVTAALENDLNVAIGIFGHVGIFGCSKRFDSALP